MNLESELAALKSEKQGLSLAERSALACRLAKQFEKAVNTGWLAKR